MFNEKKITNDIVHPEPISAFVLKEFEKFYSEFLEVPKLAKSAFERRDFPESLRLSAKRLQLYSASIEYLATEVQHVTPGLTANERLWEKVEKSYRSMVGKRYSQDLALAYCHSVRRKLYQSEWRTEDYANLIQADLNTKNRDSYILEFHPGGILSRKIVLQILHSEPWSITFADIEGDAARLVNRLNENLQKSSRSVGDIESIEIFRAGFYRNRGAYLVGRMKLGRIYRPFIVALLNSDKGIYVDALITSTTFAHNMFSSTLANFHVTTLYYHELCLFLKSIMPMRPLGLHYSTIGYNHLGKVAVMNEIESEITSSNDKFGTAVGMEGTVAICFSTPDCSYCLKVIRNTPTKNYKWKEFEGIKSVLAKYKRVHEINRTDSMLDSIIYYNLRLDKHWFSQAMLDELLECASDSIIDDGKSIIFKYLIVQRKLVPLPVYLESATQANAEKVIMNLGYCIMNNSAANIFNKDLDARNYGVTSYSKVYLYDYDALEKLTDVKVRTNRDRYDGEEEIPEWFFESGVVFLPEEIVAGLCIPYRSLRNVFSSKHSKLLTVEYWQHIQDELRDGNVPGISVYPDSEKLQ